MALEHCRPAPLKWWPGTKKCSLDWVWKVPSHSSILRFLMSMWKWSLTSQVYVSGVSRVFPHFLTDGEQQVLLECGQDGSNVSLNLGLFRWNGWIRRWHVSESWGHDLQILSCALGAQVLHRVCILDAQPTPAISPLKLSEILYDIYIYIYIQ